MERKTDKLERVFTYLFLLLYGVGTAGHLIDFFKNIMLTLTPYVLFGTSAILIYLLLKDFAKANFIWLTVIYSVTLLIEIAGVKTGYIFGSYYYGDVLGVKLFEVPLVIGLNWVMVLAGVIVLINNIKTNVHLKSIIVGLLAVVFDFVLEPAAINLGYWNWSGGEIPVQNYAAWFLIAVFSSYFYSFIKADINIKLFSYYYFIQLFFFLLLNLFYL